MGPGPDTHGRSRARAGSGERGEHRTRSAMSSRGDCSSVVRRLFRLARACMGESDGAGLAPQLWIWMMWGR